MLIGFGLSCIETVLSTSALRSKWGHHLFSRSKLAVTLLRVLWLSADTSACVINDFWWRMPWVLELKSSLGLGNARYAELSKQKAINHSNWWIKKGSHRLKIEWKAPFFIASCGISYAVLQFSSLAAFILFVVSFSLCSLEDIVKGE